MRYIRTKDGIYENKPLEVKYTKNGRGGYSVEIKETDIINQADTIEELCDEFVVIEDRPIITKLGWLDFQEHKNDLIGQKVYGAIWNDKGLIYVAKIDKNGVLKLL